MNKILSIALFSFIIFASSSIVAQDEVEDAARGFAGDSEAEGLVPLEELRPLKVDNFVVNQHIYDYGMVTSNSLYLDSTLNNGLFLGFYRPFFRYVYKEKHSFNIRGKFSIKHWDKTPSSGKKDLPVGSLEIFRGDLKFGKHRINVGRRFFRLGRGLLFNNFGDGLEYIMLYRYLQMKTQLIYSGDYGNNCTISIQGCGGGANSLDIVPSRAIDANVASAGKRAFVATEITGPNIIPGTRMYALALYSKDLIQEANATTKTAFNPYYAGLGIRGFIVNADYRYSIEGAYQGGKSFDVSNNETSINAWAGQAEFKYSLPLMKKTLKPNFISQVAIGSGDDKTSVNQASGSNKGGVDTGFYYFGSYSGGLGLKPRLSNLKVVRLGFTVKPLFFFYSFRTVGIIANFSLYQKVIANALISDTTAVENSKSNSAKSGKAVDDDYVGGAVDVTLIYNVSSDVKFFYAVGFFKPGTAYPIVTSTGGDGRALRTTQFISLTLQF